MGVVYRGTQLVLGRPVAVKAIAPELAEDPSYRERFKRESQLAASIDHPNVIPVYEAGEWDGMLYLIMRWVEGTDLRAMLSSSGRLPPARAVRLLRPVASALGAAHQRGLVHRDIKPANVLIAPCDDEREDDVYLTDFGIARRSASQSGMTGTGMLVGTVDYMAPERISGGKGDAASDIYSFGCMLFEALSGQLPFDRPTNVAKVFAHVNDPVPSVRAIVPEVPERLDDIVRQAMTKRPEERFSSAGALTRALGEALDELDARERVSAEATVLEEPGAPEPARAEPTVLSGAASEPTVHHPTAPDVATVSEPAPTAATPLSASMTVTSLVRRRKRRALGAASAVVLVAIAVAIAVASIGGRSGSQSSAGAAARIPTSREIRSISSALTGLQTVALGSTPGGVSIAPAGDVWVSLTNTAALVRLAPNGPVTRFAVGGHPGVVAGGPAGVWVSGSSYGSLARLDERTGRLVAAAQLTSPPTALAIDPGDGSAWAADSSGAISHVDPSGSLTGQPARVPPPVSGLGFGEGWVWAVNGKVNGLVRVNVDGTGSTTTFNTDPGPVSVTFDQGIWTAHSAGNVTRFDPRPSHLAVNTDVAVANSLDAINAIEGQPAVWAISKKTQTLYRISTQPSAPVTAKVRFASAPVALAVGRSSVFVATEDGNLTQIGF
jgi:serine/threonine-protein kinase